MVAYRPRETPIVRDAMKALNALPGGLFRKKHGTAYGVAGDPDIYGSFNGRAVVLEGKAPGKEPSELQRRRLREWAEAGAITGWFTSSAEAVAIVTREVVP